MDKISVKDQRIVFMADEDERKMLEHLQQRMARNMSEVMRYALHELYEQVHDMPFRDAVVLGRQE